MPFGSELKLAPPLPSGGAFLNLFILILKLKKKLFRS